MLPPPKKLGIICNASISTRHPPNFLKIFTLKVRLQKIWHGVAHVEVGSRPSTGLGEEALIPLFHLNVKFFGDGLGLYICLSKPQPGSASDPAPDNIANFSKDIIPQSVVS